MIKTICWIVCPILWSLGGWKNHWIRRLGVSLVLTLVFLPILRWWSFLFFGLIFGATTLPYGDEPTDLPRWLCGLAYAFPLAIVAWFSHKWLIFGLQCIISAGMGEWINNWLNSKIKWYSDRITEFLTCLFSYCLVPFIM
jgi:hypothetical protein